jgi:hypothetical protein
VLKVCPEWLSASVTVSGPTWNWFGILAVPHGIHGLHPQVGKHAREIAREAFRKIEAVLDTEQQ